MKLPRVRDRTNEDRSEYLLAKQNGSQIQSFDTHKPARSKGDAIKGASIASGYLRICLMIECELSHLFEVEEVDKLVERHQLHRSIANSLLAAKDGSKGSQHSQAHERLATTTAANCAFGHEKRVLTARWLIESSVGRPLFLITATNSA